MIARPLGRTASRRSCSRRSSSRRTARGAGKAGARVVTVKGIQFASLVQGMARAGRPVEFRLGSGDVNHNLGVYTELFQVQVLPGKTQKYVYTFRQPGTYRLVCLELCGLDHHLMSTRLQVGA